MKHTWKRRTIFRSQFSLRKVPDHQYFRSWVFHGSHLYLLSHFWTLFFFLKTKSHSIIQGDLKLKATRLPLPLKCWDCRYEDHTQQLALVVVALFYHAFLTWRSEKEVKTPEICLQMAVSQQMGVENQIQVLFKSSVLKLQPSSQNLLVCIRQGL